MKRFLLVIATVTLLLTLASSGEAWQVNVKNSCNQPINIVVSGEHLFWRSNDCLMTVQNGTTASCQMPGAICPYDIYACYLVGGYEINKLHCGTVDGFACCWNVNVEVLQSGKDTCRLERR